MGEDRRRKNGGVNERIGRVWSLWVNGKRGVQVWGNDLKSGKNKRRKRNEKTKTIRNKEK
jgi:hypothetical protein